MHGKLKKLDLPVSNLIDFDLVLGMITMINFTLIFLKATKNSSSVYRENMSVLKKNFTKKPIGSVCEGKKISCK